MIRKLALLGAVVLLLAACARTTSSSTTPSASHPEQGAPSASAPSGSAPEDGAAPPAEVPPVLRFEASTVSGDRFRGPSLTGRPVLLWFWAPWCPTCRGQIPQVSRIAAANDRLAVVGVAGLSQDREAIADFAAQVPGVTHLSDGDGTLWRHFGIKEQSSFVLLDESGERVLETGYGGSGELDARIDAVLD